jgi:hypothetical protein
MSNPLINLSDNLNEHRLRGFLKQILRNGSLGIAILDSEGNTVLKKVAEGIKDLQFTEILSRPEVGKVLDQMRSPDPPKEIHRITHLPVYVSPLILSGTGIGCVASWFPNETDPASGQREFQLISNHLNDLLTFGYELDNLSSEIVRNYDELALLYNLSVRLGAQPDIGKIGQIVAEQVQSILPDTKVALMKLSEEDPKVVSLFAIDGSGTPLPRLEMEAGTGITGKVMSSGRASIVCNVREHPEFVETGFPVTSMLCVPLMVGNKVLGTLNVIDKADGMEFTTYDMKLVSAIAAEAAVSLENARLFGEVKEVYLSAVKSLVMAIDAKDPYTHSHSLRVSELSIAVAQALKLDSKYVEDIGLAALLHDVGKIGVPEHVLLKPGRLTPDEWEAMKQHPIHSTQILKHFKPFQHIAEWVCYEHERHDGKGYPHGLQGEEIPLPSRIIAAADAFDASTSDRYYRKGRSEEEAIEILKEHSGTQFDPAVIEAFVIAFQQGKLKSHLTE